MKVHLIADGLEVKSLLTGTIVARAISPDWARVIATALTGPEQKGAVLRLVANPVSRLKPSTGETMKLKFMKVELLVKGAVVTIDVERLGDGTVHAEATVGVVVVTEGTYIEAAKRAFLRAEQIVEENDRG